MLISRFIILAEYNAKGMLKDSIKMLMKNPAKNLEKTMVLIFSGKDIVTSNVPVFFSSEKLRIKRAGIININICGWNKKKESKETPLFWKYPPK